MELTDLPIWRRLRACKPTTCKAKVPINILRAVRQSGNRVAGLPGPQQKTANYGDYFSGLDLIDLYGTARSGLPARASKTNCPARKDQFTQAERDRRRELADPPFRRAQKRRREREAHRRAVILHIGDRAALRHDIRGQLHWGGAVAFSFTGNYKNGSYNPTHAQPGVRTDQRGIVLEGTGNRKPIVVGPVPNKSLLKAAALTEPHPSGLFCVPVKNQTSVFACMDCDGKKWFIAGFCVSGTQVPECVARGVITLEDIRQEENSESKRICIERFGYERYIRETGATELHHDDFGTLYDLEGERVVKLINTTHDPDGTYRIYFRRVPESCATAHEAVAWSFGMTVDDYKPEEQS